MSIIIGNGMLITYMENEIECPICNQIIDTGRASEKSKYPIFNMRCPKCKGKITISEPIFGGTLKAWETECPKSVKRLKTETLNKVNGKVPYVPTILDNLLSDNDDQDDEDEDDDEWAPKPKHPKTV